MAVSQWSSGGGTQAYYIHRSAPTQNKQRKVPLPLAKGSLSKINGEDHVERRERQKFDSVLGRRNVPDSSLKSIRKPSALLLIDILP